MMKKPVLPRMLGLFGLYCVVFFVLVILQFSKKGNFTQTIGTMVVSGQYDLSAETLPDSEERPLAGGVQIYFGGLEFILKEDNGDGLTLIDSTGNKQPVAPEYLIRLDDAMQFRLPGGTEITFSSLYAGGVPDLRIDVGFSEDFSSLEIPFKPRRSSVLRDNDQFTIAYNGAQYQFTHSGKTLDQGRLVLDAGEPVVSYRVKPEKKVFNPDNYAVAQAQNIQTYNEALTRWKDQSFSIWNQVVPVQADEDMVIAYCGEAVRRGNYKTAVASITPAFLEGSQRSYESSVFLGSMNRALRSFVSSEQGKINRVSRFINEKSPGFLRENHVMDYLLARAYTNFADDGIALLRTLDPAALTLELVPGIFEGYVDLKNRAYGGENPFGRFTDQACFIVSGLVLRNSEKDLVFIASNGMVDTEFNFRLGRALTVWAVSTGSADWAALGRSLVLSVIGLRDNNGFVPANIAVNENGVLGENSGGKISSAKLYRLLESGEYYPHAVSLRSGTNNIWAWATSPVVRMTQEESALVISVSFPMNETHYMMIRGVRPFTRIQLYNTNWPSDPQFERYDSSGWIYSPQDQVLVLKMKHRVTTEQIKVFYEGQD